MTLGFSSSDWMRLHYKKDHGGLHFSGRMRCRDINRKFEPLNAHWAGNGQHSDIAFEKFYFNF